MSADRLCPVELPVDARTLRVLRDALAESPVIVELKLGERAGEPERLVFYRYELLVEYLRMIARPGDMLAAWRFDAACRTDNALVPASVLADGRRDAGA